MSLVMAAISYRSRSALHSASISAVLPEPTGPPTPTRSGPWELVIIHTPFEMPSSAPADDPASIAAAESRRVLRYGMPAFAGMTAELRPEQPCVLGFVAHAGEIGAERRPADLIERRDERARGARRRDRLERGKNALPVGLAERHQPQ